METSAGQYKCEIQKGSEGLLGKEIVPGLLNILPYEWLTIL
jgi:hypothetical protein